MAERKVKAWITINGVHVPIYEGESKEDAVKRSISKAKENVKANEDQKEKDIARNKAERDKLNEKSKYEQAGLNESEVKEYLKNNPDARREANMLLKAGRDFDEASIWAYKAAMHDKNVTKTKSIKDLISDTKKLSDAREKGKDVKKAEKEIQDNFKAYFNNMSAGDYFVVKYDLGPDDDKYREVYIKKSTGDDGFYFKTQRDGRRSKEIDNSLKGTSGGSSDGSAAESIVRNISWSHQNKGNFDITFGNANSETLEELKRRKFN